jgi:hypothetical protein
MLAPCQYMVYTVLLMALMQDKQIQMRATAEFIRRIDEWRRRQPDGIPSRADAIRRLIERGLEAEKAPVRKAPR